MCIFQVYQHKKPLIGGVLFLITLIFLYPPDWKLCMLQECPFPQKENWESNWLRHDFSRKVCIIPQNIEQAHSPGNSGISISSASIAGSFAHLTEIRHPTISVCQFPKIVLKLQWVGHIFILLSSLCKHFDRFTEKKGIQFVAGKQCWTGEVLWHRIAEIRLSTMTTCLIFWSGQVNFMLV